MSRVEIVSEEGRNVHTLMFKGKQGEPFPWSEFYTARQQAWDVLKERGGKGVLISNFEEYEGEHPNPKSLDAIAKGILIVMELPRPVLWIIYEDSRIPTEGRMNLDMFYRVIRSRWNCVRATKKDEIEQMIAAHLGMDSTGV